MGLGTSCAPYISFLPMLLFDCSILHHCLQRYVVSQRSELCWESMVGFELLRVAFPHYRFGVQLRHVCLGTFHNPPIQWPPTLCRRCSSTVASFDTGLSWETGNPMRPRAVFVLLTSKYYTWHFEKTCWINKWRGLSWDLKDEMEWKGRNVLWPQGTGMCRRS